MRRRERRSQNLFERVRGCPIGELPMILDAVMESIVDHISVSDTLVIGRAYIQIRSVLSRIVGGRPFDYPTYLQSPEWKARRDERVRAAGNRCQVCNRAEKLNVHHRTYERIGDEIPDDLIVLCEPCHELFHKNGRLAKP